nr:DUF3418 domain-containing protein [Actinomycetales bacterium]
VEAPNGTVLGTSKSLLALQRQLAQQAREAVSSVVRGAVRAAAEEAERDRQSGGRAGRGGSDQGSAGGSASQPHSRRAGGAGKRAEGAGQRDDGWGAGKRAEGAGQRDDGSAEGESQAGFKPHSRRENAGGRRESEADLREAAAAGNAGAGGSGGVVEKEKLTEFPGEVIPASVTSAGPGGFEVRGYPALTAEREGVALRVLPSALEQARANRAGVVALALGQVRLAADRVTTRWTGAAALTLAASPYANTAALVEDVQRHAARSLAEQWAAGAGGAEAVALETLRRRSEFESLVTFLRERHEDEVFRVVGVLVEVLTAWRETDRVIRESSSLALLNTVSEVRDQVSTLVYAGFVAETPASRLKDLTRYLRAARLRVERAAANPRVDATAAWKVSDLTNLWEQAVEAQSRMAPDAARETTLAEVRWLLEELRVSLFAQQLGTSGKISEVRIRRLIES